MVGLTEEPTQLEAKLRREVVKSREAALEPSTQRNLQTQWINYTNFAKRIGKPIYPITIDMLCLYAQFLSGQVKSPQTIRNYISGICTVIHVKGGETPQLSSPLFKLTLKGITKRMQHTVHRAHPITPEILLDIHKILNHSDSYHAAIWAALLFGFLLLLRKSNLVPDSAKKIELRKLITGEKIKFTREAAIVSLNWTKTRQTGENTLQVPLLHIPNSKLSPLVALKNIQKLVGLHPNDPIFRYQTKAKIRPLTYPQLNKAIKELVSLTGRDGSKFSSHSLRRGGATYAAKINIPAHTIQTLGDWKSDAYKNYIESQLDTRTMAASTIKQSLLSLK